MRIIDLTTNEEEELITDDLRELTEVELANLSGGASAFLRGKIVRSQVAAGGRLKKRRGGTQRASFPTHIANARFTQSATTLCNWKGCTYYISGC